MYRGVCGEISWGDEAVQEIHCCRLDSISLYPICFIASPTGLTKCESERSSSLRAENVFVPACDANGAYKLTQCQAGGQCWCVDSEGNELVGTRHPRGPLDCSECATLSLFPFFPYYNLTPTRL